MGVMKKYIGAWAQEIANLNYVGDTTSSPSGTISFKDINGVTYSDFPGQGTSNSYSSTIYASSNGYRPNNLYPKATGDLLSDYDINDYTVVEVGTTSCTASKNVNINNAHLIYNIVVTNNTENEITFSCIKFLKNFYRSAYQGNITYAPTLMYAYFLDEPITVAPGETESINVNFEIKVE